MFRYLLGGILSAALVVAGVDAADAGCSYDGQNRWMTVDNKSRHTAYEIYIRPSSGGSWRPWSRDLLGPYTIGAHRSRRVEFDYCDRTCLFDIKVVKAGGGQWYFPRVDVCRLGRLRLY